MPIADEVGLTVVCVLLPVVFPPLELEVWAGSGEITGVVAVGTLIDSVVIVVAAVAAVVVVVVADTD